MRPNHLKQIFLVFILFFSCAPVANAASSIVVLNTEQATDELSLIQSDVLRIIKSRLSRTGYPVDDEMGFLSKTGFEKNTLRKDSLLKNPNRLRSTNNRFQLVFIETLLQNRQLRISAEIYSSAAQSFIASWSMPVTNLVAPNNCDLSCIRLSASEQIEQTADSLAFSLTKILQMPSGATGSQGDDIAAVDIELLDFTSIEKVELLDLMTNEFPQFYRISKTRTIGPLHLMTYHSSAPMNKLHKWLVVSLKQIGLDPDQDVEIIITNERIQMKKTNIYVEGRNSGNSARFN